MAPVLVHWNQCQYLHGCDERLRLPLVVRESFNLSGDMAGMGLERFSDACYGAGERTKILYGLVKTNLISPLLNHRASNQRRSITCVQ